MQYAICTRGTSRGIQYTRCKMQGARATSHTNGRWKMQYAPTIITRQQPTTALLLDPRQVLVLVLIQLQLLTLHDHFCIRFRFHLGFDVFYKYDAFACWNDPSCLSYQQTRPWHTYRKQSTSASRPLLTRCRFQIPLPYSISQNYRQLTSFELWTPGRCSA